MEGIVRIRWRWTLEHHIIDDGSWVFTHFRPLLVGLKWKNINAVAELLVIGSIQLLRQKMGDFDTKRREGGRRRWVVRKSIQGAWNYNKTLFLCIFPISSACLDKLDTLLFLYISIDFFGKRYLASCFVRFLADSIGRREIERQRGSCVCCRKGSLLKIAGSFPAKRKYHFDFNTGFRHTLYIHIRGKICRSISHFKLQKKAYLACNTVFSRLWKLE